MIAQEFGTISGVFVADALIIENAAYWYGNEDEKKIAAEDVRSAFYIKTNFWKNEIVERGKYLYNKSLQYQKSSDKTLFTEWDVIEKKLK